MPKAVWKPPPPPGLSYKQENLVEIRKASRFLYQVGEVPELRMPSKPVNSETILSPETQAKLRYVRDCLRRYTRLTSGKGKGLAAIQVGIHERFFVAYMDEKNKKVGVFIDPVITDSSTQLYLYKESCMSANSLVAPVIRPTWITFTYYDEKGKERVWKQHDTTHHARMLNRVFQHEIDHLEGVINIDLVPSVSLEFESRSGPRKAEFIEVSR